MEEVIMPADLPRASYGQVQQPQYVGRARIMLFGNESLVVVELRA